jgi:MFS transporter, BCD family, chlorophyll transporter
MLLEPYSPARLLEIVAAVAGGALVLTTLAIWGIERRVTARPEPEQGRFRDGIAEIWA